MLGTLPSTALQLMVKYCTQKVTSLSKLDSKRPEQAGDIGREHCFVSYTNWLLFLLRCFPGIRLNS